MVWIISINWFRYVDWLASSISYYSSEQRQSAVKGGNICDKRLASIDKDTPISNLAMPMCSRSVRSVYKPRRTLKGNTGAPGKAGPVCPSVPSFQGHPAEVCILYVLHAKEPQPSSRLPSSTPKKLDGPNCPPRHTHIILSSVQTRHPPSPRCCRLSSYRTASEPRIHPSKLIERPRYYIYQGRSCCAVSRES